MRLPPVHCIREVGGCSEPESHSRDREHPCSIKRKVNFPLRGGFVSRQPPPIWRNSNLEEKRKYEEKKQETREQDFKGANDQLMPPQEKVWSRESGVLSQKPGVRRPEKNRLLLTNEQPLPRPFIFSGPKSDRCTAGNTPLWNRETIITAARSAMKTWLLSSVM